jgi:hypothetical protein
LGISRRRDVASVPQQAAGAIDVRWSLAGELACAFIDAPHLAIPPTLHAAALDSIHRRICVLPVRFGVALHDETEIQSMLQNRRYELLDRLDRLDRTCEMGLRIATPADYRRMTCGAGVSPARAAGTAAPQNSEPQSPLAYIEGRRTHYRRIDENTERESLIVRQFVERLCGCYQQWRRLQSSPSYPIRLAFLVERECVAAFRSRLENACDADREGQCAILGPWPPYSFV